MNERRKFIKNCACSAIGIGLVGMSLQSCGSLYYAKVTRDNDRIKVLKSEFWTNKNEKKNSREYVLIKTEEVDFPICLYKDKAGIYTASLMMCTHRSCELNIGGGIYTCPCHGSEFSMKGEVLEGPAGQDLQNFKIELDNENIYIHV